MRTLETFFLSTYINHRPEKLEKLKLAVVSEYAPEGHKLQLDDPATVNVRIEGKILIVSAHHPLRTSQYQILITKATF